MSKEISEGVFLNFTPDEAKKLWEAVKEDGFSPDKDGLKEWIFDLIDSEDEPENEEPEENNPFNTLLKNGAQYLKDHPEQLDTIKKVAPQVGATILKKAFKFF